MSEITGEHPAVTIGEGSGLTVKVVVALVTLAAAAGAAHWRLANAETRIEAQDQQGGHKDAQQDILLERHEQHDLQLQQTLERQGQTLERIERKMDRGRGR